MNEYQPGVCNIDQSGAKKRFHNALFLFGSSFFIAALILYHRPEKVFLYHFTLFLIFFSAMLNFFQARRSFCAGHAFLGSHHFGGSRESISDEEKIRKDRRAALKMLLESFLVSIIFTSVLFLGFLFLA